MGGMSLAGPTWPGAAGYLGMWMAMMIPMMLPALVPMLARYRRSMRGTGRIRRHGLTTLAGVGYFAVWAGLGVVACAGHSALGAVEARWTSPARWLPLVPGAVLLLAGGVQLSPWKARQLAHCRDGSGCGRPAAPGSLGAWRHGLALGLGCSRCCGNLMLPLLAIGMMNPVAMAAVTLAVAAERLAPHPVWLARVAGAALIVLGALRLARV